MLESPAIPVMGVVSELAIFHCQLSRVGSLARAEVLICKLQQSVISIYAILDTGLLVGCDEVVADLRFTRREDYDGFATPNSEAVGVDFVEFDTSTS